MKKILILYPHFPPSNLAGVHRPRLFAQHLPEFGWEPVILTVHEKYYEESLDFNLEKLLNKNLRIEKVKAFPLCKPRLIGDIGLRAFFQLYRKANRLIKKEGFDFLYIPIPSFYIALLGRWLQCSTGIKYGIDYIDPWVHEFPGSNNFFSRHWFSTKLAKLLEPIAIKKAVLITGVSEGYYKGVIERNPSLSKNAIVGAMPYGGEISDHQKIRSLNLKPYLFEKKVEKIQLVYAGAMLPKAYVVLEEIFKAIQQNLNSFNDAEFHFIGTGKINNDPESFAIRTMAQQYGLWGKIVFEYPVRIPYLDVLVHLDNATGVFILGSTEAHYTPSKVYQGVLGGKFILAVLHQQSSAAKVIENANAGTVLTFDGLDGIESINKNFLRKWALYKGRLKSYNSEDINMAEFSMYSARSVTKKLADLLNKV